LLLASACGRESLLPPGRTPTEVTTDAGPTPTTPPPDTGASLRGDWSGVLAANAPDFAFGPFQRLTLVFDDTPVLLFLGWDDVSFLPKHSYGPRAPAFPLTGEREIPFTDGSLFTVHVTVMVSEFSRDHFHLRYRVVGTGMTVDTDYVEDVSGRLTAGGLLEIRYSLTGRLLGPAINATASGEIRPA
jgi:hypothetical protein